MKVTYSWLKTYTDFTIPPEELVNKLTMLGLEVDSYDFINWDFEGIVVGEVTKKEIHKNSNKLWVCEVNIGNRNLSIVCGAPNVEEGQKVPVAIEGVNLPIGQTIQRVNIRGIESEGMICSEAELGISSRREGIMVLDPNLEYGKKLNDVLGDGEIVIDIDVTPNRPDCFGAIGIAREIAAIANTPLTKPEITITESDQNINDLIKINILNPEKCPRYTARFIANVVIKPSPWWLVQKLEAVGIRSINNIVDVTNYVMMETGQPLHAFDYDLLKGREINVKTATEGQIFVTLDDKAHTLNSECLMICDGEREVAVGGVMGGLNSEISSETINVLLESAYFNPVNIRRTSKKLGSPTESSRRFERGTDPNGVLYALNRATQLIAELSGGEVAKGVIDVYPSEIKPVIIKLRPRRVQKLLGVTISVDIMQKILTSLDFKIISMNDAEIEVEAPTFRPDITREADLIEEVARVYGFENVPEDTSAIIDQLTPRNPIETFTQNTENTLLSLGFSQVATYSFINEHQAELFSDGKNIVHLINPLSEDLSTLRPALIPGLLNVVRWNLNRKNINLKLFEVGKVFHSDKSQVNENIKITAVVTGNAFNDSWKDKANSIDIYDVKGYVECLLRRNRIRKWNLKIHESVFTNQNALSIEINNETVGLIGELKKEILEKFDIEEAVFVFDLNFTSLFNNSNWQQIYSTVPKYPPIKRDIAITIEQTIESEKIAHLIETNGGDFLQKVTLFDVFTGEQIGSKNKSLAFNLTFFSFERTLTEEEVDSQINIILDALARDYSACLRT